MWKLSLSAGRLQINNLWREAGNKVVMSQVRGIWIRRRYMCWHNLDTGMLKLIWRLNLVGQYLSSTFPQWMLLLLDLLWIFQVWEWCVWWDSRHERYTNTGCLVVFVKSTIILSYLTAFFGKNGGWILSTASRFSRSLYSFEHDFRMSGDCWVTTNY